MPRIFISHATRDRSFVEDELLGLLKALGVDPWYAREDIPPTTEWQSAIQAALGTCEWFMLVMSPGSAASEWVKTELQWALANRPGRIFPVVVESCPPDAFPGQVPQIQQIDFSADRVRGRNQLVAAILTSKNDRGITGEWAGRVQLHEPVEGLPSSLTFEGSLSIQSNTVVGSCRLSNPEASALIGLAYSLKGVLHFHRFLQLDYISAVPGRVQFGCIMLEIDSVGREMVGKLVGFGAVSEQIVTADVKLVRQSHQSGPR